MTGYIYGAGTFLLKFICDNDDDYDDDDDDIDSWNDEHSSLYLSNQA